MPIEDRVLIQTIFHPILIRDIAPEIAIRRLGYTNVRLSKANQALLVDALERHQLSRIEERELFAEIGRLGGPNSAAARPLVHQLINDNLWMVARIVRSYLGRGLPLADLFQEGVFGLYRAIATFDVETGSRFMKYGGFWVRQVILRAVSDKARLIRLPVHVGEMMQVSEQTTLELEQALQRPPTTTELASALGTTPKRLTRLLLASQPPLSLERSDEDLSEALIDAEAASAPETAAVLADLRTLLRTMLAQFPERERQIMELRYGLIDSKQRSLEEVASEFGITRERVRQIESKILQRLGHERFAGRLAGYLDSSDKLAWGNAVGSDRYWTGEILQNDVRIVDIRDFKNFVFGLESLSLASLRKLRWRYVLKAKELSLDRFPLKNGLSLDAVLDEITFQTLIRNIAAELQSINKYLVDIGDQTYVESPRVKRVLSSIHIEVAKFHRKLTIDQINIIERSFWYRVVMGYLQQLNTAINEQERIRTASEETKQTAKSSKSVARSKRKNCSTLQ